MAATKNLVIDQGATFSANIQYLDNSKNPISLAGYNVRSKIRTSYDSPNAVTLTATVTNASTGNVNLYLDAANTSLVHYGRYVYDVEAYSGNTVIRLQEGAITVTPGVSGNSVGSILKQTLNSLVNGSYTVSLDANGSLTFPGAAIINGNASISGNVIGSYFIGNGALLTNVIPAGTLNTSMLVAGNTLSAYASKYLVEYNPTSKILSYSSAPSASRPYISGYSSEIHVSPVAADDTGNGTIGDPVKTIAQAKVLLAAAFETTGAGQRKTIILHPGDYSENVTIDTQYTVLTSHELIGKSTTLSGTLTITKGCTIDGLKITNLVISATSAFGSVDIIGCTVTTAATKTSTAYANFRGCDLSSATLSITGAGSTVLVGGNYFTLAVNNAAAGVLAKAVITMGPVTLTSGTLQLSDTLIYALTPTANAVTQSAGSVLTLNNCQTLLPTLDNVARNSFGGYYSILHSVYDKANSTFGGVSLNSISYSQYINADRLTLSSGGQISFPDGNIQTTAFVSNNYVSKTVLKSIVASSNTWAEFQANIAAL